MQVGTMFTKIVTRKLQGSRKAFQFMVLAGFDPRLTQRSALYFDTLGPNANLLPSTIEGAINKLKKLAGADETQDVSTGGTIKQLEKVLAKNVLSPSDMLV